MFVGSRLRASVAATGLVVDETGDFLANAVAGWEWRHRWPKAPAWLAERMFGTAPPRFNRP